MLTKRGLIAARRLPGPRESRVRYSRIRKHRVLTRLDHRHDLDPLVGGMSERIGNGIYSVNRNLYPDSTLLTYPVSSK